MKHGSIPVALISIHGPLGGGPYAATSPSALDTAIATTSGGASPCGATACWSGVTVPAHELLVAVQAAPTTCYSVTGLGASLPNASTLRIDIITTAYHCADAGGGGQVPIQPDVLLAIPLSALPAGGRLTVEISGTFSQGKSTSVVLPGS